MEKRSVGVRRRPLHFLVVGIWNPELPDKPTTFG
jgi:hypothetical protein